MIKFKVHDHEIHVSEDHKTAIVFSRDESGKLKELEKFTTLGPDLAQTQAVKAARRLKYEPPKPKPSSKKLNEKK